MKKLSRQQKTQEDEYTFPYHYLDLNVELYRLIYHIPYLKRMELIKSEIKPFKGQSVLDAGCGDGRLCFELKKENLKVVGIDYSEKAVSFAKAFNPDIAFHVGDLTDIKFNQKFDFIVMMETLEHIPPDRINKLLLEIKKLLKKEGKFLITIPSTNVKTLDKHYQHFSKESLQKTLSPFFKIVKLYGYSKLGYKNVIFQNLQRIGLLIYLFKKRTKIFDWYYESLKNYYEKNISVGKPEECSGLIAVCESRV